MTKDIVLSVADVSFSIHGCAPTPGPDPLPGEITVMNFSTGESFKAIFPSGSAITIEEGKRNIGPLGNELVSFIEIKLYSGQVCLLNLLLTELVEDFAMHVKTLKSILS